jgi:hypothetical protein
MPNTRKFTVLCIAALLAVAAGCSRNNKTQEGAGDYLVVTPTPAPPQNRAAQPQAESPVHYVFDIPAAKRIAVIFGYGYNEDAFVSGALAYLKSLFACPADAKIILPLVFPGDWNAVRISSLGDKLEGLDLAGIVTLGSPERTHSALAAFQERTGGGYPVISLFPQDEILGTEALSDLVIDFEIEEGGIEAEKNSEKKLMELLKDTPVLLGRVIYYVSLLPAPPPKDGNLYTHAIQMAGQGWKVLPYIDAETGMHPVNHFVITKE